jgi:hypothetical protein
MPELEPLPKNISDEMETRSYGTSAVSIAISLKRIADTLEEIADQIAGMRMFK